MCCVPVVGDVLVDLVGDGEHIELLAEAGDDSSSARVKTLPVGLLGEFKIMALVRGENARRSSARSKLQSGGSSSAPGGHGAAQLRIGPVVFVERLEDHHLVAGIGDRDERSRSCLR